MRIASPFKDYYDSVLKHNQDDYPVFVRKTSNISLESKVILTPEERKVRAVSAPLMEAWRKLPTLQRGSSGVIAFCGRLYYFYRLGTTTCYTLEEVISALENGLYQEKELVARLKGDKATKRLTWHSRWYRTSLDKNSWEAFQEVKATTLPDEVFRYFGSPILMLEDRTALSVNPRLNTYNFASQVDPYTAYQEIDMFVGNNLVVQEDPNAHLTDDLKRHAKGFDEWSFRKHKTQDSKYKKKHGTE